MAFGVVLPKTVAIQNRRLAFLHFSMVFSLLFTLLYTKLRAREHLGVVFIHSNLEMQWDEMETITAMEGYLVTHPDIKAACDTAGESSGSTIRWGHNWTRRVSCAKFCNLDEYLSHESWRENMTSLQQNRATCWSSFKDYGMYKQYTGIQFMESRGPRDVAIVTSKNDWHVDHTTPGKTNFLELVPQSKAAVLTLGYTYELASHPSWFPGSSQHHAELRGSQQDARTLILDAEGRPVGDPIPPGDAVKLSMDELWQYAERPEGAEALAVSGEDLANGAEVRATVACFADDRHLLAYISEQQKGGDPVTKGYSASLQDLVCVTRFEVVSTSYSIHRSFVAPLAMAGDYSQEVLSETTGFSIKVIQETSEAGVWDGNTLLLQITSVLVLLAVPVQITAFLATRLLGPLSRMYKRMLIEPYCIEEVAAMTSTVLAQNVASFHQLSNEDDDGEDTIKLHAVQLLIERAFAHRSDVMSASEVQSLAAFLYKGIMRKRTRSAEGLKETLLSVLFDIELGTGGGENSEKSGITLDQWNQCRLDCEKITFEALVKLFDKDRRRSLLEQIFTPGKIKEALKNAMTPEEKAKSHFPNLNLLPHSSHEAKESSGPWVKPQLRRSRTMGRKASKRLDTVHLPAEFAVVLERLKGVEEDMEELDRVACEARQLAATRHPPEPNPELQLAQPAPSAPTSRWAEAESPLGTEPAALLLESQELREAFTHTLPALAEKLTAIQSSVNSLAGDVAGLSGTAPNCEACDSFWAEAILKSLPPDVMQELDDVRGGMEELAKWQETSAQTPTSEREGHGQARSSRQRTL